MGIAGRYPAVRRRILLGALFVAVVAVMLRPTGRQLTSSMQANLGDPSLITYLLRWGVRASATGLGHYSSPPFYWPTQHVIALSDPLTPLVPVYAIFYTLTGNLALALTLTTVALLLLSLGATFALARDVGCSTAPSLLAAFGFTFSGSVLGQWGHVQLFSVGLISLGVLELFRLLRRHRLRDGAGLGVVTAALMLCSLYYGAVFGVVVVVVVLGWAARRRQLLSLRLLAGLGLAGVVAAALTAPVLGAYVSSRAALHTHRQIVPHWGLTLIDLVRPADGSLLWRPLAAALPGEKPEHQTFPGVAVYLLALLGLVLLLRRVWPSRAGAGMDGDGSTGAGMDRGADDRLCLGLLALGGVVALALAAGSSIGGVRGPFVLLHNNVPGFDGIRVPARFVVVWLLAVVLLAAYGMQHLLRVVGPRRLAPVVAIVLPAVVLAENSVRLPWVHLPLAPVQTGVDHLLAHEPPGAVIELPMPRPGTSAWDSVEPLRMLYATQDWHPRVNGYSGYFPPGYAQTAALERTFPAPAALGRLRGLGVRWVIIHVRAREGAGAYSPQHAQVLLKGLAKGTPVIGASDGWLVDLGVAGRPVSAGSR